MYTDYQKLLKDVYYVIINKQNFLFVCT